jgi:type II secretory pathway pseudopilin PulG
MPCRPGARRGAPGLTLAETVIAMALIGIALVPLMMMLPGGSSAQLHAQRVMLCTLLAERKMEESKSALITDFDSTPGGEGDFSTDGYAEYRYSVTIADVSGSPLKSIHVLVWEDHDGDGVASSHERQTTLDTLVARAMSRGA